MVPGLPGPSGGVMDGQHDVLQLRVTHVLITFDTAKAPKKTPTMKICCACPDTKAEAVLECSAWA